MIFIKGGEYEKRKLKIYDQCIGKGGETFFTHCQTKKEVQKWIEDNQDKLDTK
jgi:hypothetical protein